jgi:D-glycero-beta-D-manno-heptose 1-phosphate adenylyltransferase
MTLDEARRWRRAHTGKVVFTNGVFDILHSGHVALLTTARGFGDALIVGVNSDASVRRLNKGSDRPQNPEAARAIVLAALEAVDVVVVFDEDTPLALVMALEPDVLVKGGDYREETIVGAKEVRANGGDVQVVPILEGFSTTSLIEKIRGR